MSCARQDIDPHSSARILAADSAAPISSPSLVASPMSDVDWFALWSEFAQATDNKQLEVAERIVYFDGRWNFSELSGSKLIGAARQIIRERVEGSK